MQPYSLLAGYFVIFTEISEVTVMYRRICPDCGASLDPGEICDCQRPNDGDNNEKAAMPASTAANPLRKGDIQ